MHRSSKAYGLALTSSLSVGALALTYTTLNKLGVGVSIHSFVTSASVQGHYGSVLLVFLSLLIVAAARGIRVTLLYVSAMLFFYSGIRSFSIAKPALL